MNAETMMMLHAGGVTQIVGGVLRSELPGVIERLTTCHPHVFVVDGSLGPDGPVAIGVSERGLKCLAEHLHMPELVPSDEAAQLKPPG